MVIGKINASKIIRGDMMIEKLSGDSRNEGHGSMNNICQVQRTIRDIGTLPLKGVDDHGQTLHNGHDSADFVAVNKDFAFQKHTHGQGHQFFHIEKEEHV